MTLQKSLPVVGSIAIILLIAVLRERSRTLAAILVTMPINVPLGLWLVASSSENDARVMTEFMRTALLTLIPSVLWLLVVFVALRAGWTIWQAIGAGYGLWVVLIAIMFWLGWLSVPM